MEMARDSNLESVSLRDMLLLEDKDRDSLEESSEDSMSTVPLEDNWRWRPEFRREDARYTSSPASRERVFAAESLLSSKEMVSEAARDRAPSDSNVELRLSIEVLETRESEEPPKRYASSRLRLDPDRLTELAASICEAAPWLMAPEDLSWICPKPPLRTPPELLIPVLLSKTRRLSDDKEPSLRMEDSAFMLRPLDPEMLPWLLI